MQEKHFIPGLQETVQDRYERNRVVIEDFHKNEGRVGGNFANSPILLLTHTGAKTGQKRVSPMLYMQEGSRMIVFAAFRGSPRIQTGSIT